MAKLKPSTLTREQYLNKAVGLLRPLFKKAGHELPEQVKVTCGWPSVSGTARKKRRIGECWASECSKAKVNELFISPTLSVWTGKTHTECAVGDVLVHELCHAVDDCQHAHKGPFVKIMKAVGLEGKPTSTFAGKELHETLKQLEQKLGAYPHSTLDLTKVKNKTQTTRLIKAECPKTDYCVRITRKWLEEVGAPICPCCKKEMSFEIPEELVQDD